jgi:hypothetical protein
VTVSSLFDGTTAGVFHLRHGVDEVVLRAEDAGWHVVSFDTSGAADRDAFMAVVAEAFDLPSWFARNWDSLDECLRAIDLDDPDGLLVLWHRWADFAVSDPDGFESAIEVFHDATVAWRDDEVGGTVLLIGDGPETDLTAL